MKKFLILLLLFCTRPCIAQQQGLLDSLDKVLQGAPDSTRVKQLYAFAYKYLYTYPELAFKKAEESVNLAGKTGMKSFVARGSSLMGVVYKNNGEYKKALEVQLKALKMNEELGEKKSIAISNNDIGILYKVMKDYPTALKYYRQSLQNCREIDLGKGIAMTLSNIGTIHNEMGANDSAMFYYKLALDKANEINDKAAQSNALDNIGELYGREGNRKKALEYFLRSLALDKENQDMYNVALSSINIGGFYIEEGDYGTALKFVEDARKIAVDLNAGPLLADCYEAFSNLYEHKKDFSNSLKYHKLFTGIRDSMLNSERTKQLAEMQTKYETEKKEKEIDRLTQDKKIAALQASELQLQLSQRRTQIIVLGIAILFVIVVSFLLYNRNKLKQREEMSAELLKQEQLRNRAIIITQENERKRIAEELHDGIGQMLSAVKLNVAALETNLKEKNEQFSNAVQLIDESCKEIRTISHNMMPGILIKAGLVPAVKEFVDKINSSGKIKIAVEAEDSKVR
ncbi:MAG TPA: tetratricopeptide repeat protein, partial [Bacteroidia bacterium]